MNIAFFNETFHFSHKFTLRERIHDRYPGISKVTPDRKVTGSKLPRRAKIIPFHGTAKCVMRTIAYPTDRRSIFPKLHRSSPALAVYA